MYSEAPSAQPRRYRSVLSNLQNALSLFLGRIRISKGSNWNEAGGTKRCDDRQETMEKDGQDSR